MKKCGDANPKGNIEFFYKGGCKKNLKMKDAYRCVGCGAWFHLDCILKHFELEEGHDNARYALMKIKDYVTLSFESGSFIIHKKIIRLCKKGLKKSVQGLKKIF